MRLRSPVPAVLAALALVATASATPARAADYVPGEVLVGYRDGSSTEPSKTIRLAPGESVARKIAELRGRSNVQYAVPNYIAHASFYPNDPGNGGLGDWHRLQWNFAGPAGVNAPAAWDIARALGAPGGRGVVVAVLDTGVAYQTRGRFRRSPDVYPRRFVRGYDFVDDDPYPNDENGHGTHVAGTIAERTNNGIGLTGLAYGVKIMPLRVLDYQGAGDANAIARAIRFAARHGADVINMSLEFDASVRASQIPDIVRAIRYAHGRGAVVVAASGNEGNTAVAYPARTSFVISVGATTANLCQAEYSNSGQGLDVVAPGGGTDAASSDNPWDAAHCDPAAGGPDIYQETFTRNLRTFGLPPGYQGTSMASPHVAATAALILATKRLGAHPTPEQVEARLKSTARDLGPPGYDRRYGAGLIDAAAAINPQVP
jgi:serine protease